jgi:molybdate transport system ATP-binding protein
VSLHATIRAFRDSFDVEATLEAGDGETLALLGPNGAGKSTVVLALAGLISTRGEITLAGERLEQRPPERRPLGISFQGGSLFPHLDVVENVAFPLRARGVRRREARARAAQVLSRLAPDVRPHARPGALSGGEAQRVSIARAVVHEPRLLLLDEPTAGLDVEAKVEIRPSLAETLASFPGVRVLVTHDPIEAMTLADRVVVLESGRVTQAGSFEDVRRTPKSRYAAELVGVNVFAGRLDPIEESAGRLVTANGEVIVAWPEGLARRPAEPVTGTLRPSDVVVHLDEPARASARNRWRGPVMDVSLLGERVRVRVGTRPTVTAELTAGSVDRLGLARGAEVWISFKAVEVELDVASTPSGERTGTLSE